MKVILKTKHGFTKEIRVSEPLPELRYALLNDCRGVVYTEAPRKDCFAVVIFRLRHVCSYSNTYYYEEQ
jgi:hypothetical protein